MARTKKTETVSTRNEVLEPTATPTGTSDALNENSARSEATPVESKFEEVETSASAEETVSDTFKKAETMVDAALAEASEETSSARSEAQNEVPEAPEEPTVEEPEAPEVVEAPNEAPEVVEAPEDAEEPDASSVPNEVTVDSIEASPAPSEPNPENPEVAEARFKKGPALNDSVSPLSEEEPSTEITDYKSWFAEFDKLLRQKHYYSYLNCGRLLKKPITRENVVAFKKEFAAYGISSDIDVKVSEMLQVIPED